MLRGRPLHGLAVAALFAAALGVRLVRLGTPPLDFHPTRQFRSALLARHYYLQGRRDVPEWRRRLASAEAAALYEPPLLERAAASLYRLRGGEDLRLPRLLSIAAWLLGGACVYAAARRLADAAGALVSAAFFLLCPFGVMASRAFQPDPLMVALLAAAVYALVRYGRRPSLATLAPAAVAGALAVLVKPMAAFFTTGACLALALALRRDLGRRALVHAAAFVAGTALPAAPYYIAQLGHGGTAAPIARISFHPGLWLTAGFWVGWVGQVWKTTGLVAPVAAALGVVLLRDRVARALLLGLAAGYALFVLAFAYQGSTHDYYHLPLLPIVAVGLAPLVARAYEALREGSRAARVVGVAAGALLAAACADAALTARSRLRAQDFSAAVALYREVGAAVGHAPSNVLLADDYGYPLRYYGDLEGAVWPRWYDFRLEAVMGAPAPGAAERLRGLLATQQPRFFVVTTPDDLQAQPDLGALLAGTYAVHASGRGWIVYDLARPR